MRQDAINHNIFQFWQERRQVFKQIERQTRGSTSFKRYSRVSENKELLNICFGEIWDRTEEMSQVHKERPSKHHIADLL